MEISAQQALRWIRAHGPLAQQLFHGLPNRNRARREPTGRMPLMLYSQVAWDDVWQRPQEQAVGLARHRPVIFVSPVQAHQVAGPLADRWQAVRVLEGGRLTVLSPLILTGEYVSPAARAINRRILVRALRPFVNPGQFILLTNSPFVDYLFDELRPALAGYDLIDDFCAFEWSPPDARRREARILRRADFAFAGTFALQEAFKSRTRGLEFLASGVNFTKLTTPAAEPDDIKPLPHPRLLYVGTLNDRLDGNLIADLAKAMPKASVILVGPRRNTFHAPPFPANVKELGLKPHDALAGYYQHTDLGLMPFADNEAARAINPVKTLEYLACGLPVISTPVPDVRRFYEPPVVVAGSKEWSGKVQQMLGNDTPEARGARVDFARGRSWEALVDRIEHGLRKMETRFMKRRRSR